MRFNMTKAEAKQTLLDLRCLALQWQRSFGEEEIPKSIQVLLGQLNYHVDPMRPTCPECSAPMFDGTPSAPQCPVCGENSK